MTTQFTTPVGRLVGGSLYKPQDKDADGKPLVIKNGLNTGKPTVRYWIPVAIPKGAEQHWNQTAWGQLVWKTGMEAFPQAFQSPAFAWKVVDGDSTVPNKRGRRPCDNEGWAGNWILMFGGTFKPKTVAVENGAVVEHIEPDFIKPGYFVEVMATVKGNGSQQTPGLYLNPVAVCMRGYHPDGEIVSGPDLTQAGFGTAPLPPGASAVPVGGFEQAAVWQPPTTGYPPPGTTTQQPAPAPVYVQPNHAFLNPQQAPNGVPNLANTAPAAPPAPAAPVMTPAATASYADYIKAGWNDALLRQHGLMV